MCVKFKSTKSILFVLVLIAGVKVSQAQSNFITQWVFPSATNSIAFRSLSTGAVNYTWTCSPSGNTGTGSFTQAAYGLTTLSGLTIPATNTVTIQMQPANLKRFVATINSSASNTTLRKVTQWGTANWTSMEEAFARCQNLNITSTDVPNLGLVNNTSSMFLSCINLIGPANIGTWNTVNVTNMANMFRYASMFNQNIGTWNTGNVTNMSGMFLGTAAFNQAIGNWNTANVTNMSSMFRQTNAFNQPIGSWNTGNVTNMDWMFDDANAFNQAIGTWNTMNVTSMNFMFQSAQVFNQNIGAWNTADVGSMVGMFSATPAFNQPIGTWNTGSVTNMSDMFRGATAFNQSIGSWNTGSVTDMGGMFIGASVFNQPIGTWNTGSVTDMAHMFWLAGAFNQPIGTWNTVNVTEMNSMFNSATAFNQNIANWNTGNVTMMQNMFSGATAFNQNIGSWILNPTVALNSMLNNCGMDCYNYSRTLMGWVAANPTVTGRSLGAAGKQYGTNAAAARTTLVSTRTWTITGDAPSGGICYPAGIFVTEWAFPAAATSIIFRSLTTGAVTYTWSCSPSGNTGTGSFTQTTYSLTTLSGLTIPAGNVVTLQMQPTNLKRIVANTAFAGLNTTLKKVVQWGSANWTTMQDAFRNCAGLNVTATDVPNLTAVSDLSFMFYGCSSLNGPVNIGSWNTGNVTNMAAMFRDATLFNQNMGAWNTGNVVTMTGMFLNAPAFNQDIGNWNTGNVTSLSNMFNAATAFNQDIGNWNTANVTNMGTMFYSASSFNQDIGNWNTVNVNNMSDMFNGATSFNQDLAGWSTANVISMGQMFLNATAFNYDMPSWTLKSNVNLTGMLNNCGMDCSNYSSTLIGWQANNPAVVSRSLGATGRTYGTNAVSARTSLTTLNNWTITGDMAGATTCDPYFKPMAYNTVGLDNNVMANITLYPNPTSGIVTIEGMASGNDNLSMNVVNTLGQVVYQDKVFSNKQVIDLSHLNDGVYILTIISDHSNKTIRVMIKK